ncbi:MAG: tetratricopeptide repeat protein [Deltaproteobacteria bacterium]|nr:tetratricopeptide repeat protein [Deltaproteobacteria bacterium]
MSFRAIRPCLYMALFGVVLFTFLPSAGNDFVDWDDYAFVTRNHHIRTLDMRAISWMFTTFYQGVWHPLTWLSHGVDVALGGLNPSYHHLVNVLIHCLNALLFFALCVRLQEGLIVDRERVYAAAFSAALLFGVHPLRVESVAWVAERKDVLCTLFYLATLIAYLGYVRTEATSRRRINYLIAVALCVGAALSKPMSMTLPLVLLVLDFYPLQRMNLRTALTRVWEKAPFLAIAAGAAILNLLAAKGAAIPFSYVTPGVRIMNAFYGMVFYIEKSLTPFGLVPLYQLDPNADYFSPKFLFSAALVIIVTGFVIHRAFRGDRLWAAAWFYYLITLAPALGLFMSFRHAVADRYSYLPTLSFWLLVGLGFGRLWAAAARSVRFAAVLRGALILWLVAATLAYAYQTREQIAVWRNSVTLWSYVIDNSHYKPDLAFYGLGRALETRGELDRALESYQMAVSLNPAHSKYVGAVANIMARKGHLDESLAVFRDIQDKEPQNPRSHIDVGRVLSMKGRLDEAAAAFKKATEVDPQDGRAWALLAVSHLDRNDKERAVECYKKYLSLGFPRSSNLEFRLGWRAQPEGAAPGISLDPD